MNRSEKFFSAELMNDQDIAHVRKIYSEDLKLYDAIFGALQRNKKLSIMGGELR